MKDHAMRARIVGAMPTSPVLKRLKPEKIDLLALYLTAKLNPEDDEAIKALPLDLIESETTNHFGGLGAEWEKPQPPPPLPTAYERLADANEQAAKRMDARDAARRNAQAALTPAELRAKVAALPAHLRLAYANDPVFRAKLQGKKPW